MMILKIIAGFLLRIFNWNPYIQHLNDLPTKCVLIYPHTSFTDLPIALLYRWYYGSRLNHVYYIAKPQLFIKWLNPFLKFNNMIPSIKLEDKNQGFVNRTVQQFKDKEKYIIAISPEGSVKANKWRSGYFHLASELNVPIVVAGLDTTKRELIIKGWLFPNKDREGLEKKLHSLFSKIDVKNPQNSYSHVSIF